MSFASLLNKRCSWRRPTNAGTSSFGELIITEQLVASDRPCARQVGRGNNMRQLIENKVPGDFNYKLVMYYLGASEDIQENDIMTFESSEHGYVRDVKDAAGRGHHLEVLVERVQATGEEDQS